jgi:predicted nucleic acid-binding protein
MNADVFIDTNVLLYSLDEEPQSQPKRQMAQQILMTERWGWSVQVAAEFFVNATSPKRPFRMAAADAAALLENWFQYPILELTPELVRESVDLHQRFQISYWDAAILVAAKRMNCQSVYSEDLNAGQTYDGVLVINPFASSQTP